MANVKTIILAGGSGFLGQSAAVFFKDKGYAVTILSRQPGRSADGIDYVQWDGKNSGPWEKTMEGADAVINFTGKSVNCIYNDANKAEIIASRIDSVKAIANAINKAAHPPALLIQAASLAIYGNTKDICTESAPHGEGFSVEVCEQWEEAFFKHHTPSRKVLLRIGFALGKDGGALEPLVKLTNYYLGGTIGKGDQYISWLHVDDLNSMYEFMMDHPETEGIFNATGPKAVTNMEFMQTLRQVMHRPFGLPAPEFMVKIGARYLMKADASLALTGRNCIPEKLNAHGFKFKHTNLKDTLETLVAEQ
jgi:uncharacterized protein (TIGR01777 family)